MCDITNTQGTNDFTLTSFHIGFLISYIIHQFPLWAIFYVAVLFWAVVSPFQYQIFKNEGRLKYVYTAMIIAGVLLPCVPAVINVAFGYGIMTFSPMRCDIAVQDVGFYTGTLTEGIKVAILGTLQALVILKLTKVCIATLIRLIAGFQFYFVCVRVFFPSLTAPQVERKR